MNYTSLTCVSPLTYVGLGKSVLPSLTYKNEVQCLLAGIGRASHNHHLWSSFMYPSAPCALIYFELEYVVCNFAENEYLSSI
jgi:hypothetical protein